MSVNKEGKLTVTTWDGCYDSNWNALIVPDAFSHPAKMANGLVNRIFDYAIERGWIVPGKSVVVDPFGGIGSTGIVGASKGVKVLCCELEAKFVQLARGGGCPGNRWPVGMGIVCSDCAGKRGKELTESHHVTGNFELHRRTWEACGDPLPVIVQGDSRRLCEVLGPALADCCIGSPPFAESLGRDTVVKQDRIQLARELGISNAEHISPIDMERIGKRNQEYGSTDGQLGAMPTGSVEAIISSPPYSGNEKHDYRTDEARYRGKPQGVGCFNGSETYGDTAGNLGNLPSGDIAAIVSSPPFSDCERGGTGVCKHQEGCTCNWCLKNKGNAGAQQGGKWGETDKRNIGILPPGDVSAIVSSPPYAESCVNDNQRTIARDGLRQGFNEGDGGTYGSQDGQLAAMPPGDVADALISSPPYEGSVNAESHGIDWSKAGPATGNRKREGSKCDETLRSQLAYGKANGQIGAETGETFWSAAREIVLQCHQILRPGGIAIWVCKDFVRNRERVPFSADWLRLCEACGFDPVQWIKASLVKESRHPGLFGEEVVERTERKGFFRRLAEKKGSPPINEEDVIIVRKPKQQEMFP